MAAIYRAGAAALIGLVLIISALLEGQWYAAGSLLCATSAVAFVVLVLNVDAFKHWFFLSCAAGATLLGIFAVFFQSNAFNMDLQNGYVEAETGMQNIATLCKPQSPQLLSVQEVGILACYRQAHSDKLDAVVELAKNKYFGPGLTMVDAAKSLNEGKTVNLCASAFKDAEKLCPNAFKNVNAKYRSALLKAAE